MYKTKKKKKFCDSDCISLNLTGEILCLIKTFRLLLKIILKIILFPVKVSKLFFLSVTKRIYRYFNSSQVELYFKKKEIRKFLTSILPFINHNSRLTVTSLYQMLIFVISFCNCCLRIFNLCSMYHFIVKVAVNQLICKLFHRNYINYLIHIFILNPITK